MKWKDTMIHVTEQLITCIFLKSLINKHLCSRTPPPEYQSQIQMEVLVSQKTLKDWKTCHKLGRGPSPKLREPVSHSSNPVTPHQRQGQVTMGFRTH